MVEFHSIPLEVQLKIFSYLPFDQAMEIRSVCKQWNRLIKAEIKLKRLFCFQIASRKQPGGGSGENYSFMCFRSFLDYTRSNPMFSRVKYLEAYLYPNYAQLHDAFDLLNSFRSLREITFEFHFPHLDSDPIDLEAIEEKQLVVSLDRLEKAKFIFNLRFFPPNISIVLDVSDLHYLIVDSLRGLIIKHPEKLRTLETQELFEESLDYSKFIGLCEIYSDTSNVQSITARFIESLPSLRGLYLDRHEGFSILDEYEYCPKHDRYPTSQPGKGKAKIFYFGFQITLNQINQLNERQEWPEYINYSDRASTFIARNLHQSVDRNLRVYMIDYNAIAGQLNDTEMFEVMPQKFHSIVMLDINGAVADPNRLLKFIDRFKIKQLDLRRTSLPRWFFEKLPESGSSIYHLSMSIEPTMRIMPSDLEFIFDFKFRDLDSFGLSNCPLSLDIVVRLLREPKRIGHFFQFGNYSFSLRRLNGGWAIDLEVEEVGRGLGGGEERFENKIHFEIPSEEAGEFANILSSRLKADGFVNPKELLVLLRQLELEKETHLFMMRKFVYEQRHSIGISMEQWRLLNFSV